MSTFFDLSLELIILSTEISGPGGTAIVKLALDTGATRTLINPAILNALGYDTAITIERIELTTGSGVEYAALLELESISCLNRTLLKFPVVCHTLPPSSGIDGLLGLDFLKNGILNIDFKKGEIEFTSSKTTLV